MTYENLALEEVVLKEYPHQTIWMEEKYIIRNASDGPQR
jgi:hypothetical protein